MRAIVSKCSACFMCHGMHNTKKCIGKCHSGKTLGVMHPVARRGIPVIRIHQIRLDHLYGMNGKCVRVIAVCCGHIGFHGMCHGVHTGMCNQLLRHGFRQVRVHNGNIRCNFKIRNRVFDSFFVIRDNGKSRYLRCSAGSRRYCTETCFCPKLRKTEHLAHIFKGNLRVFIFNPHGLGSINRGTAAHGDNPVRFKFSHCISAFHNCFHRRIRLNSFKYFNLHACFFQITFRAVQKSKTFHGTAAHTDHGALSFKILKNLQSPLPMV